MYGLPRDVDLRFFFDKTLIQVCVGANDLVLNFDGRVSITVTSAVGCAGPDGAHVTYKDFSHAGPLLFTFLSHTVAAANGTVDGTLTLRFRNGRHLELYDDSKEYESYTIRYGDHVIVV
jgi:Family of unknown function (DUF6188)